MNEEVSDLLKDTISTLNLSKELFPIGYNTLYYEQMNNRTHEEQEMRELTEQTAQRIMDRINERITEIKTFLQEAQP
jgi:hypothetical protein